jgi:translation initiation factor IF-2
MAQQRRKKGPSRPKKNTMKQPVTPKKLPDQIEFVEGLSVVSLSDILNRPVTDIIKRLMKLGVMAHQNQPLDRDVIELLAIEYGIPVVDKVDKVNFETTKEEVNLEDLEVRPPVVTIMGHVDHGKTTLLDTLRNARVVDGEAGGITQHIGAYMYHTKKGDAITFIDTPGHAAFTEMRSRGAQITDITIVVVAADDGVMPQTKEAIDHAKAANVPIIVAVNKVDKPNVNPDKVKQELAEFNLIPEEWGGDTIFVEISALKGTNLDQLIEMILLTAEVAELKANPNKLAIGTVIEAKLDKQRGPLATLLVQDGTLKQGDTIVVGGTYGRVRSMNDDLSKHLKEAGPSRAVEITGLSEVPLAGDAFKVFEDDKEARQISEERSYRSLQEERASQGSVSLENLFKNLDGESKQLNIVLKGDTQGSVEAVKASLEKISVEGAKIDLVRTSVGPITESDVSLAQASQAIIIGFGVRPDAAVRNTAEEKGIEIRLYSIIYKVIEEIELALQGMLDPEFTEVVTGQAEVRDTFKISKVGTIAGCYVTDGFIKRDALVRIIRQGVVVYEGKMASLKRFKDDAKEVKQGFECGIMIENFNDLKAGDLIEASTMNEVKR